MVIVATPTVFSVTSFVAPIADMRYNCDGIRPNGDDKTRIALANESRGGGQVLEIEDNPEHGRPVIESITGHRKDDKDKTLLHMQVYWKNGGVSWEPEKDIQLAAAEVFFEYWSTVEGGRSGAIANKDLWHVLKIEAHRRIGNGCDLEVSWVGSRDRSSEPERTIKEAAPQLVNEYWDSQERHQPSAGRKE
ncbi:chromo domain-containing protein [Colletotrichum incanum]|uniref:Chromo domain-containing protein n=1 Tax=Colletotrichum incanum TaxID=1573173 RepID=A0A162NX45_COLIC|nr:chromo domain-containing protein [Colletotrichum incanum]